jgi:hypothetical protein
MTTQFADKLLNLHPRVRTDGLLLYGVIRGDPRTSPGGWGDGPAFSSKPIPPELSRDLHGATSRLRGDLCLTA